MQLSIYPSHALSFIAQLYAWLTFDTQTILKVFKETCCCISFKQNQHNNNCTCHVQSIVKGCCWIRGTNRTFCWTLEIDIKGGSSNKQYTKSYVLKNPLRWNGLIKAKHEININVFCCNMGFILEVNFYCTKVES